MGSDRNAINSLMSDDEFSRLAYIMENITGIELPRSKKDMLITRLSRHLRERHISSFRHYLDLISNPENSELRNEAICHITTNITSFFRENHHFDFLVNEAIPSLKKMEPNNKRIKIWSAGCSTGEEPYSIAIALLREFGPEFDFQVLATDIDKSALEAAKKGEYRGVSLDSKTDLDHSLFTNDDGSLKISTNVRQKVFFNHLNLMDDWPKRLRFDVIFFRNVAIYFSENVQSDLWGRLNHTLREGGFLMIGHSERICGSAIENFIPKGKTVYEKVAK